ncbi:DUF2235 domain-containing protein [Bradyrhizobium sp. 26S5]|uniref:DUF2235 domain-containing protein n=1 Tax=Bradyrhizobium sp. 26S5 TaxID=3139729 RepID=UPI0030D0D6F3
MPKNIVLLSDGTGNSSAKVLKTNVWRMFQTLDLSDAQRQIAYYDNGIGTSSFKLFAILGGIFGFGLKRNVIDIYSFCCRNYVPGDRIYGFGFSRGAFTMRVVAGLIANEGLVPYHGDEIALARYATDAYRGYRRRFSITKGLVTPLRDLRDGCIRIYRHLRGIPQYEKDDQVGVPQIHFLGLWDTVDAYGGPIEEIVSAIDYWYWPLSMPDRFMSSKIHRACHALALEDERDAFRPVLWDERYVRNFGTQKLRDMQQGWSADVTDEWRGRLTPIDNRRLSQVWFVGVHADIGGGYPQDGLSYFTLSWMLDRAAPFGLLFNPPQLKLVRSMADRFDKLNDSRHGLAGYYRYKPRNVHELSTALPYKPSFSGDIEYMLGELINRDPERRVEQKAVMKDLEPGTPYLWQPDPIIHKAVFQRIEATAKPTPAPPFSVGTDGYVPIMLPAAYQVTDKAGDLFAANDPGDPEPPRHQLQTHTVWNMVWLRRIVYFLTVFASVALAAVPLLDHPTLGADTPLVLLRPLIALAGAFLPSMVAPWLTAYSAAPGFLVLGGVTVAVLLFVSGWLQTRIRDVMRMIWMSLPVTPGAFDTVAYAIRTQPAYRIFFYWSKHQGLPSLFAALILLILLALASQTAFRVADSFGAFCVGSGGAGAGSGQVNFATSEICMPTKVAVVRDEDYRITIDVKEGWSDQTIATDPRGFGFSKMSWPMYFGLPFRRVVFASWFAPVIRIGAKGGEEHVLDIKPVDPGRSSLYEARFRPRSDGEVFIFVNDAVWGLPSVYGTFYANNGGSASVTIEHLQIKSRE